jgi:DNA primase
MLDTAIFARHLDLTPLKGRTSGRVVCIFHDERTPSLSVDLDAGIFHCFACGEQGGVREFTELLLRRGFIAARALGRRQAWNREPVRSLTHVQERLRSARREIDTLRASADDSPAGWARLAHAADLERAVLSAEAEVDEAMGW